MSDDGFVDRPDVGTARAGREGSLGSRLLATAENGKALLIKATLGGSYHYLAAKGVRIRQTKIGAPAGMIFAWCERIEKP